MPATSQDWLRIAAQRVDNSVKVANEVLNDSESPKEAIDSARRLVAKCDLLLTVALHRYLRMLGQS